MPSKNDLSALKMQPKHTLKTLQNADKREVQQTIWRKPKPLSEKQSEIIGLRFTQSEYDGIKKRAGLVPIATYLKDMLRSKTNLFDS